MTHKNISKIKKPLTGKNELYEEFGRIIMEIEVRKRK